MMGLIANALQDLPPNGQEFHRRVADWPCIWTSNGLTDTAIWTKPG
jgi:hypothetical protein